MQVHTSTRSLKATLPPVRQHSQGRRATLAIMSDFGNISSSTGPCTRLTMSPGGRRKSDASPSSSGPLGDYSSTGPCTRLTTRGGRRNSDACPSPSGPFADYDISASLNNTPYSSSQALENLCNENTFYLPRTKKTTMLADQFGRSRSLDSAPTSGFMQPHHQALQPSDRDTM